MSPEETLQLLSTLLKNGENEVIEFKRADKNFSTPEIGKYFSALSNEANLRAVSSAWLVFGIDDKTRQPVGTDYCLKPEHLSSLKQAIANGTQPQTSFREIHESTKDGKRVLLFEIGPAPQGMPIAWNGHCYARNGESLSALSFDKLDSIRAQSGTADWSMVICEQATLADLDPEALKKARDIFVNKRGERLSVEAIRKWDEPTFLNKIKLTIDGRITRAALLLLGRPESTHHLSPYVAELSWKLEGAERAYEHFHPPFLLSTSWLYQRIRNTRLTLLLPGQLIPYETPKYDQRIVLEVLHNCIAHQNYLACERILVIERTDELEFHNAGNFYDGSPDDYVLRHKTPRRYRNRFLAEAMVELGMIDKMGYGIHDVMFGRQIKRNMPLPDFDLSHANQVSLKLPGRFIDENYSRALATHQDFKIEEILALDRIQKGTTPDSNTLATLRKRGLIEGRKPALHISAKIAEATGQKAAYIRNRPQNDEFYSKLILDHISHWGHAGSRDIRELILPKLTDALTEKQKNNKLNNLLSILRKKGKIVNIGARRYPRWELNRSANN